MPFVNNQPPVVTGPIIVNMIEDSFVVPVSPAINAFDPDLIDLVRATGIPEALPEGFSFNLQFHHFVIDSFAPAFQSLAQGQLMQIIINFFATDGFALVPHSLIVTMTGVNDLAVIAGATAAVLTEDAMTHTSGTLTVTDVDNGEAAFQPVTAMGGVYGQLSLTADGQWSYILDTATVQPLNTGQTVIETFAVHSVDGTEQILTFTIEGVDETLLIGTAGNDVLNGTAAGEMLLGLAGRDLLNGNGGRDTLEGGTGADSLYGQEGDDVIEYDPSDRVQNGGSGVDTLRLARSATVNLGSADQVSGDSGVASGFENVDATLANAAVTLTGSAGVNALAGGSAADRLTGGLGSDVLYGNAGADRFILRSVTDSQGAGQDKIADFTHGSDKIDLSAIDALTGGRDNGFAFIGQAGFARSGQLRYDAVSGAVEGDVNGDLLADFSIQIGAGMTITASDFVL
jgi:VCBS repeat-containing protein